MVFTNKNNQPMMRTIIHTYIKKKLRSADPVDLEKGKIWDYNKELDETENGHGRSMYFLMKNKLLKPKIMTKIFLKEVLRYRKVKAAAKRRPPFSFASSYYLSTNNGRLDTLFTWEIEVDKYNGGSNCG